MVAPDDPVMQELAPLVAAVQMLPPVTRQQMLQLWQDTLQLVQGGSGPRREAGTQRTLYGVGCTPLLGDALPVTMNIHASAFTMKQVTL